MDNTTLVTVPVVAILFEPFLLTVFLVAVVSNTMLLALICKAYKVINSTNIYLFSLAVAYLIRCFYGFTLIVTLPVREWIFGGAVCSINQFVYRLTTNATAMTYLVIARDRYRAVIHPSTYSKVKKRNSLIKSIILWLIAIGVSLPGTIWAITQISATDSLSWSNCFGEITDSDIPSITVDFVGILLSNISVIITLIYYGFILKELNALDKLRSQYRMLSETSFRINLRDRPVFCSAEERAAKSLAVITFFQFACGFVTNTLSIVRLIELLRTGMENEILSLLYILFLFFHVLPILNPVLLIAFNKRYRNRLKGLFKCELMPESNGQYDTSSPKSPELSAFKYTKKSARIAVFISENPTFNETDSSNNVNAHHRPKLQFSHHSEIERYGQEQIDNENATVD